MDDPLPTDGEVRPEGAVDPRWSRLAEARSIPELLRWPLSVEPDGYGVDYVSWGHYRPSVWRNVWHTHSFVEVCLAYAGDGTFRLGSAALEVGRGSLFVARPGDVHEIESSRSDPLGIVFWGFALRRLDRTGSGARPGWWSGLLDGSRPVVSERIGHLPGLLDSLAAEARSPRSGGESVIAALAGALAVETGRAFVEAEELRSEPPPVRDRSEADAAVMLRYLRDNLARSVAVADVAAQVHLSERQAQRVFTAVTGESLMGALRRIRLEQAAALLLETSIPVKDVGHRCGYTDQRAFGTAFLRRYGQPASRFRASQGTVHLGSGPGSDRNVPPPPADS